MIKHTLLIMSFKDVLFSAKANLEISSALIALTMVRTQLISSSRFLVIESSALDNEHLIIKYNDYL